MYRIVRYCYIFDVGMTNKKIFNGSIIKEHIVEKDLINLSDYCDDLKGVTIDELKYVLDALDNGVASEIPLKHIYFDELGSKPRFEKRTILFEYVLEAE